MPWHRRWLFVLAGRLYPATRNSHPFRIYLFAGSPVRHKSNPKQFYDKEKYIIFFFLAGVMFNVIVLACLILHAQRIEARQQLKELLHVWLGLH